MKKWKGIRKVRLLKEEVKREGAHDVRISGGAVIREAGPNPQRKWTGIKIGPNARNIEIAGLTFEDAGVGIENEGGQDVHVEGVGFKRTKRPIIDKGGKRNTYDITSD